MKSAFLQKIDLTLSRISEKRPIYWIEIRFAPGAVEPGRFAFRPGFCWRPKHAGPIPPPREAWGRVAARCLASGRVGDLSGKAPHPSASRPPSPCFAMGGIGA